MITTSTTLTTVREQAIQELSMMSDELVERVLPLIRLMNAHGTKDGSPASRVSFLPANQVTDIWNTPEEDEQWQDL
jgi:hypothetical protein